MGEPHTPPSGTKRGRQIVVIENSAECSPVAVPSSTHHGSRSVRRRRDGDSPSADAYEFLVYLPNKTSVEMKLDFATCKVLTVQEFVERVSIEQSLNRGDNTKQKQRDIVWKNKSNFYITDFQGKRVPDEKGIFTSLADEFKSGRGLLLHDDHPDTVHFHPDFWNVTPETHLLQILPQDYSVFSALADELDNSLQAVYQLQSGKRLICVDLDHMNEKISIYDTGKGMDSTSQNSISKWGTMGSSMYRRLVNEAIGIPPPYLKPNFGMFGLGGIGAGLHLGGCIAVSSKTKTSQRVAVLHLSKETLETNVKAGSVWKTGGEFRPPTEQEVQWSPHGSFTKVEISNLNREITTWRVEEVQRKLKDFYFPYIQNDDGAGGLTSRPVEIRVNGDDLAGVLGGEVAHTNYFSGVGEPFVLYLQFAKSTSGGGPDKANARITCRYFPINKGREAIDDILEKLKDEDPKFMEPGVIGDVNFDNYSRRSVRRLGRLLPRARGGRLPFMEPKKFHRENEVNRHCYKRAKAFIDVDAGFVPTHSKTNLDPNHAFTEALLKLGSGLQTVDSARGLVTVSITHNGAVIKPEQLHSDYKIWITKNHKFDIDAIVDKSSAVIVSQPHHKQELNIKDDVFRVVYDITCGDYNWKVGKEEPPIRLKLLKGLPGLNNNDMVLYVTVECFISEGLADEPGETRIICRSMGVAEERGSKELVDDQNQEHSFILGESRAFPIEILFSGKCERVDEVLWRKQEEKTQSKSPAFIELLTEQESLPMWSLKAGAVLPHEIIAVVRPKIWKDHMTDSKRLQQKYIIAESMEMTLVVWKVKYLPPGVQYPKIEVLKKLSAESTENVEKTYARKVTATTQGNLKGLYCFSTTAKELEHITRTTGTYFLVFCLVSAKYQDVDSLLVRINVAPSSNIRNWNLCSHPGHCNEHHQNGSPEVMKVRLGGVLPGKLYLSRVDEFGNPKEFEEIPRDIECGIYSKEGRQVKLSTTISKDLRLIPDDECLNLEIPEIRLGQGFLEPLKPSMQAALRMSIAGNPVASFSISVLPGGIASARMKESDAPDNGLHPGQIIEKLIFEVLDSQQNPVLSGEQVKVVLEGFDYQDKVGSTRSVDGSGCLDLGLRLRVTAGYGGEARLELRSIENLTLLKKTFKVIFRSLRTKNAPERVAFGSQLAGIEIEAVDENGQVDHTMDGVAHNLTLDWTPNISVPFRRGVCTLPPIQMHNPGMWKGRVTHSQHQKLKTRIAVLVEISVGKSERDYDDLMALENLYDISQALPDHFESKALVLGDVQAPRQALDNDRSLALKVAIQSTMHESQKLKGKLLRLGRKLKKHEDERDRLQKEKWDHDQNMKAFQSQADRLKVLCPETLKSSENEKLKSTESVKLRPCEAKKVDPYTPTTADGQLELYNTSMEDNPGNSLGYNTPIQVEMQIAKLGHPPGTNAAAILLQAQPQAQDCGIMSDVIGIVALLGAVENEAINRVLVEFLGLENMLAIICGSTRAAECFGILNNDGTLDPNQGLYGLAQSRNLQISGRFRVITLADESSFYRRSDGRPNVNTTDPQKLLNLGHGIMSGSERPVGSLGYAVNFIHLNEDQLRIRILGRYGLRESLFFVLFGFLEVFDTTVNMLKAQKDIRSSAVSLDGGIIRTSNQFEWGGREDPVVWFPTWVPPAGQLNFSMRNLEVGSSPPPRRSIPFKEVRPLQHRQLKEVMKQMEAARQRYIDKGIEENLQNITEKVKKTTSKISEVTRNMEDNNQKGHSMSKMVFRHASKKEDF